MPTSWTPEEQRAWMDAQRANGVDLSGDSARNTFKEAALNHMATDPSTAVGSVDGYLHNGTDQANSFEFLGQQGAAARERDRFNAAATAAQGVQGVQANLAQDNAYRGQQMGLVGAYQNQLAGNGPSMAGFQLNQGMGQAGALAANARVAPSNALAGSQRLGMLAGGAAANQAAMGAAGTSANEIGQARQGLGGLAGAMRGADAGVAMGQANLDMRQRGLNDQMYGHDKDMALGIDQMQQTGQQGRQDAVRNYHEIIRGQGAHDAATNADNDARAKAQGYAAFGMATAGLGSAAQSLTKK